MVVQLKNFFVPGSLLQADDYKEGWFWSEGSNISELFEQFETKLTVSDLDAATTTLSWRTINWYEKAALIRIHDAHWANKERVIYVVNVGRNMVQLRGDFFNISYLNKHNSIYLHDENVLEYLKFFGFFMRQYGCPLYFLEDVGEPAANLLKGRPEEEKIAQYTRPLDLISSDVDCYECRGVCFLPEFMLDVTCLVKKNGELTLKVNEVLLRDLPKIFDVPII